MKCLALDVWTNEDQIRVNKQKRASILQMRAAKTPTEMVTALMTNCTTKERAVTWADGMVFSEERVEIHQAALEILQS